MTDEAAKAEEGPVDIPALVEEKVPDPTREIGVDLTRTGSYMIVEAPAGWNKERNMSFAGHSIEHVADDEFGRWLYRSM